jgi:hypothetical protein
MEAALDMVWLTDFEASEEERIRKELDEPCKPVAMDCLARVKVDGTLMEASSSTEPRLNSMIFEASLGHEHKRQERLKQSHSATQAKRLAISPIRVMEDTGATKNFISFETVQKRGLTTFQTGEAKGLAVQLADKSIVRCTHMTHVALKFSPDYRYDTACYVLPMGTDVDVILGQPWIHSLGPHYKDPQKGIIRFRKSRSQQIIQLKTVVERHRECTRAEVINAAMALRDLRKGRQAGRSGYLAFYRIRDQDTVMFAEPPPEDPTVRMKEPGNVWLLEPKRQLSEHVKAGKKVRFLVDLARPDELKVITVDERDDLYPFGRKPVSSTSSEEVPIQASAPHPGIMKLLQELGGGVK